MWEAGNGKEECKYIPHIGVFLWNEVPIYPWIDIKKRGTLLLLILSIEVLEKPFHKNKQWMPTLICSSLWRHNERNTPRSIYCNLVSGERKFPVFYWPKQAQINAFVLCLQTDCSNLRCKGNKKSADYQKISKKNERGYRSFLVFML